MTNTDLKETKYFHYYNANPKNKRTKDCTYRAFSLFLNKTWEEIAEIDKNYYLENGKILYGAEYRKGIPCYTAKEFLEKSDICEEVKTGKNICTLRDFIDKEAEANETYICLLSGHVTVIKERKIWDTWDCSESSREEIYKLK